jgi:hypothetical protein
MLVIKSVVFLHDMSEAADEGGKWMGRTLALDGAAYTSAGSASIDDGGRLDLHRS